MPPVQLEPVDLSRKPETDNSKKSNQIENNISQRFCMASPSRLKSKHLGLKLNYLPRYREN